MDLSLGLFTICPENNFAALVGSFRDHIIIFGDAGKEILQNLRIPLIEPAMGDILLGGSRRYALERVIASGWPTPVARVQMDPLSPLQIRMHRHKYWRGHL